MLKISNHVKVTAVLVALSAATAAFAQQPPAPTPSQVPPRANSPQSIVTPGVTNAPSVEQRTTVLEERLNTALALKEEKIQDMKDRIDGIYKLAAFVAAVATFVLVIFSIRDVILRVKEGERQRSIDDIVKQMMKLQTTTLDQQVRLGEIQVKAAESNPSQFGPVQNVSGVIEAVQKTLAFRLEQEQEVANAIKEIKQLKADRERTKTQKFEGAVAILDQFKKMSRMQYAALTEEQHSRALRLVGVVSDLDESISEKGFEVAGSLLYTCGVIVYYDNDIIESQRYLDRAAQCRAKDHEAELVTNEGYRMRFAFIHYFRALIQKNWGEISEALHEIEQSAKLLETRPGEFLTPVTKAEIRSYIVGDEQRCRSELHALLRRLNDLEAALNAQGKGLDANQTRLRNRILLLLGNTHFVTSDFRAALEQYTKVLQFSPEDYYALGSAAQCYQALGDTAATDFFSRCLSGIERSGDLRRKRERITRALIVVMAANAARGCGDQARYDQFAREARDVLGGNLAVDGMSPKFFSPATKRLVSSTELLGEIAEQSRVARASERSG